MSVEHPSKDREPCTHELKVWSEFFPSLCDGSKPFEVRKNDRDYRVGDSLYLNEILKESGEYTSGQTLKVITYVLPGPAFGIAEGYAVLGLADPPPDAFCKALAHEPLGSQVSCKRCVCGHFKSEHSGETNTCNFEYCGCLHYEHCSTLIATKEQMAADAGPLTVAGLVYAESQNGQDEYARVRGLDDKQIVSEGLDSTSQLMRELANRYDVACEKLDNTAHETEVARPHLCISPACPDTCSGCNHAISDHKMRKFAIRYAWLRDYKADSGGVELDEVCDTGLAKSLGPLPSTGKAEPANTKPAETCQHQWISARNAVVESGEVCVNCHAIRAELNTTPTQVQK